jgi:hypothetical protein
VSLPVYDEWLFEDVPSSHGADAITYHVLFGTVNWTRRGGDEHPAFAILMNYNGRINYQMPAHILEQDLPQVLAAVERLRARSAERR